MLAETDQEAEESVYLPPEGRGEDGAQEATLLSGLRHLERASWREGKSRECCY